MPLVRSGMPLCCHMGGAGAAGQASRLPPPGQRCWPDALLGAGDAYALAPPRCRAGSIRWSGRGPATFRRTALPLITCSTPAASCRGPAQRSAPPARVQCAAPPRRKIRAKLAGAPRHSGCNTRTYSAGREDSGGGGRRGAAHTRQTKIEERERKSQRTSRRCPSAYPLQLRDCAGAHRKSVGR